jgi:hypothetical protein
MIVKTLTTDSGDEMQLEIPSFLEVLEETTGEVSHGELKPMLQRLLERGFQISKLRPGWDSYGAMPPQPETVGFALLFAARASIFLMRNGWPLIEPLVVPTPEGGIQLEWSHGSRELEVEMSHSGAFSLLAVDEEGREHEEKCAEERVFQYLRWLATGEPR